MKNRIEELRAERLWTQKRLARKARLDDSTISTIENGKREPSLITQEKIARAFGLSRGDVFPPEPEAVAS